jgi:hypothetical protein
VLGDFGLVLFVSVSVARDFVVLLFLVRCSSGLSFLL